MASSLNFYVVLCAVTLGILELFRYFYGTPEIALPQVGTLTGVLSWPY